MISLVVPTKTDTYARRLLRSLATCEPEWYGPEVENGSEHHRIVFVENGLSSAFMDSVREDEPTLDSDGERLLFVSPYVDELGLSHTTLRDAHDPRDSRWAPPPSPPFVFARAINIGVEYLHPESDILIMNDDAVFCSPHPITTLEALLEEHVDATHRVRDVFGVIGPRIEGGVGNPDQTARLTDEQILESDKAICFVAALIPRKAWNEIGPMDERFEGYGCDDSDYAKRVVLAGYKLGVTGAATVRHVGNSATGAMHGSYSALGREEHTRLYLLNQQIYAEKWGESGRGEIK